MKKRFKRMFKDKSLLALSFRDENIYNHKKGLAQSDISEYFKDLSEAIICWMNEIDTLVGKNVHYLSTDEQQMIHDNFRLLTEMRMHLLDDSIMINSIKEAREEMIERNVRINEKIEKIRNDLNLREEDMDEVIECARRQREEREGN